MEIIRLSSSCQINPPKTFDMIQYWSHDLICIKKKHPQKTLLLLINRSWKIISNAELMVSGQEVCFCSVQRQSLRIILAVLKSQRSVVGCWFIFLSHQSNTGCNYDQIFKIMWNWRDFEEHKKISDGSVLVWSCLCWSTCLFVFIYLPVFLFKEQWCKKALFE